MISETIRNLDKSNILNCEIRVLVRILQEKNKDLDADILVYIITLLHNL